MPIMISALWGFATSPLGKALAACAAALALLGGVYALGHHAGAVAVQNADAKALAVAKAKVAGQNAASSKATSAIVVQTTQAQAQVVYRTQTLTKEVPVYVTAKADAGCTVTDGAVSLYNSAASGSQLAGPASGSVDAPSGDALSELTDVNVYNLGQGWLYYNEAVAWRKWYAAQKAIFGAK